MWVLMGLVVRLGPIFPSWIKKYEVTECCVNQTPEIGLLKQDTGAATSDRHPFHCRPDLLL